MQETRYTCFGSKVRRTTLRQAKIGITAPYVGCYLFRVLFNHVLLFLWVLMYTSSFGNVCSFCKQTMLFELISMFCQSPESFILFLPINDSFYIPVKTVGNEENIPDNKFKVKN